MARLRSFLILARGVRPDVVHFEWESAAVAHMPLLGVWDCPMVVSCHGELHVLADTGARVETADGLGDAFGAAAAVHCVSEAVRSEAAHRGVDPAKLHLIKTAVDPTVFRPRDDKQDSDGSLRVVTVGWMKWLKGFEYAVQAVAELARQGIPVRLDLLGGEPDPASGEPGDRARVLHAIDDLGLTSQVHVHDQVSSSDVLAYLQRADVLLHPSLSEGLPTVVLEAMACALPVVVTDCGGVREAVSDGVEGLVVPPAAPAHGRGPGRPLARRRTAPPHGHGGPHPRGRGLLARPAGGGLHPPLRGGHERSGTEATPSRCRRASHAKPKAPHRVGEAAGAPAPRGVTQRRQDASCRGGRRDIALSGRDHVSAAQILGGQPGHLKVRREPTVDDPRLGQIDDPAVRSAQPPHPVPVLGNLQVLVEATDPADGRAPHGHVTSPHLVDLGVARPPVEASARQFVVSARRRRRGVEARGTHGAAHAPGSGVPRCPGYQSRQPPGRRQGVVVNEADEVRAGQGDAGIPRGPRPLTFLPRVANGRRGAPLGEPFDQGTGPASREPSSTTMTS